MTGLSVVVLGDSVKVILPGSQMFCRYSRHAHLARLCWWRLLSHSTGGRAGLHLA